MKDTIKFDIRSETQMKSLAILTAEWTKQSVLFDIDQEGTVISIRLNGGF